MFNFTENELESASIEWFKDLDCTIVKERAIKNATKEGRGNIKYNSLSEALHLSFDRKKSPEKALYWELIFWPIYKNEINYKSENNLI